MACEGVYADVQWAEESLTNEIERPSRGRAQKAENKEQELDKEKFLWLMNTYKEFKLDYTRHFRFNSSASVMPFGENFIKKLKFRGPSGAQLLAGGPSGLLTSSFQPLGRSGRYVGPA